MLLELADRQINKGNKQHAKFTIAQIESRLDQVFNLIRTSKSAYKIDNMLEDKIKRIGRQYKMCSVLLIKVCTFIIQLRLNLTLYSIIFNHAMVNPSI